eukprot:GHVU01053204.1.p2 GENE.GHVU01053204.1~~GHVU01053204.1.p2  ORF type:complete len:123 (-),score=4.20 GHVU01053204.1:36-404(-)
MRTHFTPNKVTATTISNTSAGIGVVNNTWHTRIHLHTHTYSHAHNSEWKMRWPLERKASVRERQLAVPGRTEAPATDRTPGEGDRSRTRVEGDQQGRGASPGSRERTARRTDCPPPCLSAKW